MLNVKCREKRRKFNQFDSNNGKALTLNERISAHKPDADEWTVKINKWNWNENRETDGCGGDGEQVLCKIGREWTGREKDNTTDFTKIILLHHRKRCNESAWARATFRKHEIDACWERPYPEFVLLFISLFFLKKNTQQLYTYTSILTHLIDQSKCPAQCSLHTEQQCYNIKKIQHIASTDCVYIWMDDGLTGWMDGWQAGKPKPSGRNE